MGIRFYPPHEQLNTVVARIYVHDHEPSTPGDPPWLIVPDGDIKVIFPIAGAIRCRIGAGERVHPAERLIVSGMRTEPGSLSFPDGVHAVGLILRPEAAYRLLRCSHEDILNATLDGEELFGARARRLQEEFMNLRREEDRVDHLQTRLGEWLQIPDKDDRQFEYVVRRLKRHAGRLPVELLAREANLSRRQLERRFLQHVGVGPKRLADVFRFHAAYKLIRASGGRRYAGLVQDYYYDQSHFLKAFKRYAGITPRVYPHTRDYGKFYIPE